MAKNVNEDENGYRQSFPRVSAEEEEASFELSYQNSNKTNDDCMIEFLECSKRKVSDRKSSTKYNKIRINPLPFHRSKITVGNTEYE